MRQHLRTIALAAAVAACGQDRSAPAILAPDAPSLQRAEAAAMLDRYAVIGTSVSMGWASDGVVAASQYASWPAQLTRVIGRELDQPYLSATGCRAPMAPPLLSGVRISGEPVVLPPGQFLCFPVIPPTDLPARNVAISSATTFDALFTTPETRNDPFYSRLYPLIHPPNTTQLQAALRHRPTFVSVELGANEILGAIDGRALPGVNLFPYPQWAALYTALADSVRKYARRGVLVGLVRDIAAFPALRRGDELWADRQTFLRTFHIEIKRDCQGSPNLIVVPLRVPAAVAAGLDARNRGLKAIDFSCAGGSPTTVDHVLDPAEAAIVNAQIAAMNAFIRRTADRINFAHFELDALYGSSALKPPFSVLALMTTATPYTQLISLDGFHPSPLGNWVLAGAAAAAINDRYGLLLPMADRPFRR